MTLLVLDLKLPPHQVGRLLHGLLAQWPAYVSFCASFLFIELIGATTSGHVWFIHRDSLIRQPASSAREL
jgi:uncharacterized membrane protein